VFISDLLSVTTSLENCVLKTCLLRLVLSELKPNRSFQRIEQLERNELSQMLKVLTEQRQVNAVWHECQNRIISNN